jgi:hypothetical protein
MVVQVEKWECQHTPATSPRVVVERGCTPSARGATATGASHQLSLTAPLPIGPMQVRDAGNMLGIGGFSLPAVDRDEITMYYENGAPPHPLVDEQRNMVRSFSTPGQQSAAKGSSTTVSRSDIRLIQYFDSSAHGLVRRWRLIGCFPILYYSPLHISHWAHPLCSGASRRAPAAAGRVQRGGGAEGVSVTGHGAGCSRALSTHVRG